MALPPPHQLLLHSATRALPWSAAAILATTCSTVGALLLPVTLAGAVDAAVRPGHSAGAALVFPTATALLLALAVTVALADALAELSAGRAGATATAWLRQRLVHHVLDPGALHRHEPGDTVSRLIGDAAEVGGAPALAMRLAAAAVMSVGALAWLAVLGWELALAFVAAVPLALLLARRFLTQTRGHAGVYQQVVGELSSRLVDAAAGLRTIAACDTADREIARVLAPLDRLGVAGRALWRSQAAIAWRAGLVIPAVQLGVLAAAGLRVVDGRLTVGQLLAAAGYALLGMTFLHQAGLLMRLSRARACAGRLAEVLDRPPAEPGWRRLPPGPGRLELRGVTVHGGNGRPLLCGIDLTVPAGATVAVVGRSGSGKSVLAEVAGGLREPDAGRVLLDGAWLGEVDPDELGDAVGYAFARPVLHGATVADALGAGRLATQATLIGAARSAGAHGPVSRLPAGYRTPLSQAPMSGGEIQRLGLARAILRRPRLLVLDDATSSLDTVTEEQVSSAMASALPRVTRLIVTHRAATAARADLVVWLHDGVLAGIGPHHALLHAAGYRSVFERS